jgi:hypothetical protein
MATLTAELEGRGPIRGGRNGQETPTGRGLQTLRVLTILEVVLRASDNDLGQSLPDEVWMSVAYGPFGSMAAARTGMGETWVPR